MNDTDLEEFQSGFGVIRRREREFYYRENEFRRLGSRLGLVEVRKGCIGNQP